MSFIDPENVLNFYEKWRLWVLWLDLSFKIFDTFHFLYFYNAVVCVRLGLICYYVLINCFVYFSGCFPRLKMPQPPTFFSAPGRPQSAASSTIYISIINPDLLPEQKRVVYVARSILKSTPFPIIFAYENK